MAAVQVHCFTQRLIIHVEIKRHRYHSFPVASWLIARSAPSRANAAASAYPTCPAWLTPVTMATCLCRRMLFSFLPRTLDKVCQEMPNLFQVDPLLSTSLERNVTIFLSGSQLKY